MYLQAHEHRRELKELQEVKEALEAERSENKRLNYQLQRANALASFRAHGDPTMAVNDGSQRDTNTMLIDLPARALDEFLKLASAGTPMWSPTPDGDVEVLNLQQYMLTMSPSIFGPYRTGFAVDATRKTGEVMCTAHSLVGIFMNAVPVSDLHPFTHPFLL
jgi:homeobox-leucine zipper protein